MTTFEAKMKLDAADVNYRARLAAINDVHKAKKEQIVIEFLGDKLISSKMKVGDFLKLKNVTSISNTRTERLSSNIKELVVWKTENRSNEIEQYRGLMFLT